MSQALLRIKGIKVNKVNAEGVTPLFVASQNGHTDIVEAFLKIKGIKVNKPKRHGQTHYYGISQQGHLEIVKALRTKDIMVNKAHLSGYHPIIDSFKMGIQK